MLLDMADRQEVLTRRRRGQVPGRKCRVMPSSSRPIWAATPGGRADTERVGLSGRAPGPFTVPHFRNDKVPVPGPWSPAAYGKVRLDEGPEYTLRHLRGKKQES